MIAELWGKAYSTSNDWVIFLGATKIDEGTVLQNILFEWGNNWFVGRKSVV